MFVEAGIPLIAMDCTAIMEPQPRKNDDHIKLDQNTSTRLLCILIGSTSGNMTGQLHYKPIKKVNVYINKTRDCL